MEEKERLLEIKKNLNKKRPVFRRRDHHRRLRLSRSSWRKPKGRHNKMRERKVSKPKTVEIGYRGPAALRGLTRQGKSIVMIKSVLDLQKFNPEKEAAIIVRTLGMKKKYEIVKKAVDKNIIFLNMKNPKKFLTDVESELKIRKEERIKRAKKKAAKPKKEKKEIKKEEKKEPEKVEEKPKEKSSAAEYAKKVYEAAKPAPKTEKVPTALDLAKAKEKTKAKEAKKE